MSRSITAYIRLFMRSKNLLSYIVCNTIDISRNMKNLGMKIRWEEEKISQHPPNGPRDRSISSLSSCCKQRQKRQSVRKGGWEMLSRLASWAGKSYLPLAAANCRVIAQSSVASDRHEPAHLYIVRPTGFGNLLEGSMNRVFYCIVFFLFFFGFLLFFYFSFFVSVSFSFFHFLHFLFLFLFQNMFAVLQNI